MIWEKRNKLLSESCKFFVFHWNNLLLRALFSDSSWLILFLSEFISMVNLLTSRSLFFFTVTSSFFFCSFFNFFFSFFLCFLLVDSVSLIFLFLFSSKGPLFTENRSDYEIIIESKVLIKVVFPLFYKKKIIKINNVNK